MTENKNSSVMIDVEDDVREAAFAEGINRSVNFANVKTIYEEMLKKGYRNAEVVQVIKVEEVIGDGDLTLVDINKNEIKPEQAEHYYLILDGQHRIFAASRYNDYLSGSGKPTINVPGILVQLPEGEKIAEYISSINITKNEWKTEDYVRGASKVVEDELLKKYYQLIRTNDNKDGYPLSTLNLIYFSNAKALNKRGLSLLCKGETTKGKTKSPIIEGFNIKRGDKFISLCTEKKFKQRDITKRYLAERFNILKNEKDEDYAFNIFNQITDNRIAPMRNDKGNLVEEKVIEQIESIRKAFNSNSADVSED